MTHHKFGKLMVSYLSQVEILFFLGKVSKKEKGENGLKKRYFNNVKQVNQWIMSNDN